MAWTYDRTKHRYISDDGRALSDRELVTLRNDLADGMAEEARSLVSRLFAGLLDFVSWARAFARTIASGITAGFLLGHGGARTVTPKAVSAIDAMIAEQHGYAAGFARDLADGLTGGTLTEAAASARAELYAGASVHAYEQGRADAVGVDLPYYPGDGGTSNDGEQCVCLGNCRCAWQITHGGDGPATAAWITAADGKVCPGCEARGNDYPESNPFVMEQAA